MARNTVHFIVDTALFLGVMCLVMTGSLMAFVLLPGQGGSQAWSLSRHQWGDVHFWIAMSVLALAILHVTLNWGWVCSVATRFFRPDARPISNWKRYVAGFVLIGILLVVVGVFLGAAAGVRMPGTGGHGGGWGGQGHHGGR